MTSGPSSVNFNKTLGQDSHLTSSSIFPKVDLAFKSPAIQESSYLVELTKQQKINQNSKEKQKLRHAFLLEKLQKEKEPEDMGNGLANCLSAKEALQYFKRAHRPLRLSVINDTRHNRQLSLNTSLDQEKREESLSAQQNIELIKLNEGNFTFGVKGAKYSVIKSNTSNQSDTEVDKSYFKKKGPWVFTRHNIKLKENINQKPIYSQMVEKVEQTSKKEPQRRVSYKNFLIDNGFFSKNKELLHLGDSRNASLNSSQILTKYKSHHRSNSTTHLTASRILVNADLNKQSVADGTRRMSGELLVKQPTIAEVSKRYETADMVLPIEKVEVANESIHFISTSSNRLASRFKHSEVLNGSRLNSEIGVTYPQLLAENIELKRHLLSNDEKNTWENFKVKDKSLVKGILQGESQYYKIEAEFNHLSEIHKNSQLSNNPNHSLSSVILRSTLERKVSNALPVSGLSPEEYQQLRKKSDTRLAFMFAGEVDTVNAWLKHDQKRTVSKMMRPGSSLLDQSYSQPSQMEKSPDYERQLAKKRWKLISKFLIYLVRQQLESSLDSIGNCDFFTTPHGIPGSKSFFVSVKTGDLDMMKGLAKRNPLYLYCFDAVG